MPTITVKESSAGSAVGTNILSGNQFQNAVTFRRVRRIGVVGSSAVGNAAVGLYYGAYKVGIFYNTSSGANLVPLDAKDMIMLHDDLAASPGEPINLIIETAGATNVLVATLEIEEIS